MTMEDVLRGMQQATFATSVLPSTQTSIARPGPAIQGVGAQRAAIPATSDNAQVQSSNGSTINGVVIGLLSSFGSAILIAFIFLIVYFFKYTSSGRIL